MKRDHHFGYTTVSCAVCQADAFELLYSDKRSVSTIDTITHFDVNVGVCKSCGHVYSRSVPQESELYEYYANSYPKSTLGGSYYSLDKRIEQIDRFSVGFDTYYELGANQFSEIHHYIAKKFKYVALDEPNHSADDFKSNEPLGDSSVSLAAAYGVLEHLVDPRGALANLRRVLAPGANLLVELPSLELYSYNMTNLQFCEHLHHFSAHGFIALAKSIGFRPVHVSFKKASSSQCFLAVLQKPNDNEAITVDLPQFSGPTVLASVARVREGVELINEFRSKIREICSEISEHTLKGNFTILYGANEIAQWVLEDLDSDRNAVIVVDDDSAKQNYLPKWPTVLSSQLGAYKDKVGYVVLCSDRLSARMTQNLKNVGISLGSENVCVLDFKESYQFIA